MRARLVACCLTVAFPAFAQPAGRFPPDSLINVQVFPKSTPVREVVAAMRDFAFGLGVRCQYCHVGEEGMPLERFDFASDERRTKLVARQMMRMVQEINRRIDTIPERQTPNVAVTCMTCHRGVTRPIPLNTLVVDILTGAGADSAVRAYRALRQRHYGGDAYDFSVRSLNTAALNLARAGRFDDAMTLSRLNEEFYPRSADVFAARGNVLLLRGDTTSAVAAYREALARDSTNAEARGRLRQIGRAP
jgi:hypothetical protein